MFIINILRYISQWELIPQQNIQLYAKDVKSDRSYLQVSNSH